MCLNYGYDSLIILCIEVIRLGLPVRRAFDACTPGSCCNSETLMMLLQPRLVGLTIETHGFCCLPATSAIGAHVSVCAPVADSPV